MFLFLLAVVAREVSDLPWQDSGNRKPEVSRVLFPSLPHPLSWGPGTAGVFAVHTMIRGCPSDPGF